MGNSKLPPTMPQRPPLSESVPISDEVPVAIVPPEESASIGQQMRNRRIHTSTGTISETRSTSTERDGTYESLEPILVRNPIRNAMDSFITIQKWGGGIIEASNTEFTAILEDLSESNPSAEATFSLDQVVERDRDKIQKGQTIIWYIGYSTSRDGQRKASDMVVFRDLPERTKAHLAAIRDEAEGFFSGLLNVSE